METSEATVSGTIFLHAKEWDLTKFGSEEKLNEALKSAPEILRQMHQHATVYPISRYPAAVYAAQYEFVIKQWGPEAFREAAAFCAQRDLSTIMKLFMRIGSPYYIAKRFPHSWSHYFNRGKFTILELTPKSLQGALEGTEVYGPGSCEGTYGWSRMALEYSGAKNLKIEHPECLFKGQPRCLFNYQWD